MCRLIWGPLQSTELSTRSTLPQIRGRTLTIYLSIYLNIIFHYLQIYLLSTFHDPIYLYSIYLYFKHIPSLIPISICPSVYSSIYRNTPLAPTLDCLMCLVAATTNLSIYLSIISIYIYISIYLAPTSLMSLVATTTTLSPPCITTLTHNTTTTQR